MLSAADHIRSLQPFAGLDITITRGVDSVTVRAIHGRGTGQTIGSDHLQTEFTTDDWLIVIADLGTFGIPKRNDLIACNDFVYRVGHPNKSSKAVDAHGNDGTAIRVHSIQESQ